ncbi:hypothetical protein QTQ03_19090 [Micromonospora sp. WMMA1363]|uniref:hypothetical protein n=1 Tax=Micromonospora sp. WMMA1363 TaxID=3053985 RepID=UPI00259D2209|nr:hypothetical protein [Micromonospora sp. WMMA1363]MDM4721593.1 hypothetical protein [Micromonospora sp. WMMA1363]
MVSESDTLVGGGAGAGRTRPTRDGRGAGGAGRHTGGTPGRQAGSSEAAAAGVEVAGGATPDWLLVGSGSTTGPTDGVGMNGVPASGRAVLPTVAEPALIAARIGMAAVPASSATVNRYPRDGPPPPGARWAPTMRR